VKNVRRGTQLRVLYHDLQSLYVVGLDQHVCKLVLYVLSYGHFLG
jgi:hypothetical protein